VWLNHFDSEYKIVKHNNYQLMLHYYYNDDNDDNNNNKVAGYIHWTISKHMRLQATDKYY